MLRESGGRETDVTGVIRRAADAAEYLTEERCFVSEYSNSPTDPAVSIARARVTSGETTAWHRLDGIVERYVISRGEALVEIGDAGPARVSTGDVVIIPAGVRQRITNTGNDDLLFLCICTPRFEWRCYESLET